MRDAAAVADKRNLGEDAWSALVLASVAACLMVAIPDAAASSGSSLTEPPSSGSIPVPEHTESAASAVIFPRHPLARTLPERRHAGPHHLFHFGACLAAMASRGGPGGEEERHQSLGGEVFLEWNAAPGWLALELSAGGMSVEEGAQLVVSLLAKKSFPLNGWLEPYVGLGPIFLPTVADGQTSFEYGVGGAAITGTHIWITPSMGLVTELKYNLLHQRDDENAGLAQEFGVGAGFVFAH